MLEELSEAVNAQAIWPLYGHEVRLWYNLTGSDIAIQLLAARADTAQKLVTLGYPTNDAARAAGLDMPEHPDLDVPNVAQVIAGRGDSEEGEPNPEADDTTENEPEPADAAAE